MASGVDPLHVEGISKNFGGLQALMGVNLTLQEGERRAIIGPNGAGKTTLFHLVSGVLLPSSGRIHLFGQDVTRKPPYRRAALGLARTFQINNLFPNLTVKDNIVLSVQAREKSRFSLFTPMTSYRHVYSKAEGFMEQWGLADKAEALVRNLSYGDQRVLEVVMALAQEPKLLLLDEPTGGLSPAETATVTSMLKQLPPQITVLLIEHDMDVAFAMADRVTVFHVGQVLAEGSPAEVRDNPKVQEIYLGRPA
ncbi:MAG TPA: ABC transporter ATP-binding protein [Dehalococcoidia bacterium]|nr:ABC transporter ATP-binding protein [Dehalococcoidia bacterium]